MAWPSQVFVGQQVLATQYNALAVAFATWGGPVSAAQNPITDLATVGLHSPNASWQEFQFLVNAGGSQSADLFALQYNARSSAGGSDAWSNVLSVATSGALTHNTPVQLNAGLNLNAQTVSGNASFTGILAFSGGVSFTSNPVSFISTVNVAGGVNFNAGSYLNLGSQSVGGNPTFTGNPTFSGSVTFSNAVNFSGYVTFSGPSFSTPASPAYFNTTNASWEEFQITSVKGAAAANDQFVLQYNARSTSGGSDAWASVFTVAAQTGALALNTAASFNQSVLFNAGVNLNGQTFSGVGNFTGAVAFTGGATFNTTAVTFGAAVNLNGAVTLNAGMNLNGQTLSGNATFGGALTFAGAVTMNGVVTMNQPIISYPGGLNWALTASGLSGANSGIQLVNTTSGVGHNYTVYSATDGSFRIDDNTVGATRLWIDKIGEILKLGGGWQNWTPTFTGAGSMTVSVTSGSVVAKYLPFGPFILYQLVFAVVFGGTLAPSIYVTLPSTPVDSYIQIGLATCNTSTGTYPSLLCWGSSSGNLNIAQQSSSSLPAYTAGITYSFQVAGFYRSQ